MENTYKYIGHGVYSIQDIAHYTGLPGNSVRRWLMGYVYKDAKTKARIYRSGVFRGDYGRQDDTILASFYDLVEFLFIQKLRSYGVKWAKIRFAADFLAEEFHTKHPFAVKKIYTDTKSIFAEIASETPSLRLIDIENNQLQFYTVLIPALHEVLDFDAQGIVEKWWPRGKGSSIVVDPKRNFGQPIIKSCNIPTATLAGMYEAENSFDTVAAWYNVDVNSVKEAVEFEHSLVA